MNYNALRLLTVIFVGAGMVMSIAAGCGSQGPSAGKPTAVVPSPGAAPGDYTAQLKASATAIQNAQHR